jgi:fibronectin type 3 domain-containing protein
MKEYRKMIHWQKPLNLLKRLFIIALTSLISFAVATVKAQAPTVHSAVLTWTASTTPNVTYTVYRATAQAGPFTAIASGVTALTFSDTTGTGGTLYYYEVDAVDSTGDASGPSNEVSGTFKSNPATPSALAVSEN